MMPDYSTPIRVEASDDPEADAALGPALRMMSGPATPACRVCGTPGPDPCAACIREAEVAEAVEGWDAVRDDC